MKCLLSMSELSSNRVAEALAAVNIGFVRSGDLEADWLTEEIQGFDFLCAVLEGSGRDEPPATYLEIGVALGRNLPVLIFSEPRRRIPLAMAGLQRVEVDLQNADAIANHLHQFASSLQAKNYSKMPLTGKSKLDGVAIDQFRRELDNINSELTQESSSAGALAFRYEQIVHEIFTAGSAEASAPQPDAGYDLAVWIDGASQVLGGPILVECKLGRRISPRALRHSAERLRDSLFAKSINFGMVVYLAASAPPPSSINAPYPIWVVSAYELLETASSNSLGRAVVARRNEFMHGGGVW